MRKTILLITLFLIIQVSTAMFINILSNDITNPTAVASTMSFNPWIMGITILATNLLVILFVFFVMKRNGRSPFASYLVAPRSKEFWITIATLLSIVFWVNALNEMFSLEDYMSSFMSELMHNPLCVFAICITGPISEEVCFRRGILGSLTEKIRYRPYALLISAAIFGIIHMNPAQMFGAFILGLFLGWLYLRTHSLVLPIVCHIINNSLGVILGVSFGTDAKIISLFPNEWSFYIVTAITVVLTYILFRLLKKNMPQSRVIDDYEQNLR